MTTFEMRFIALRCKDTIAPTGTIAQGVGAKQVNAKGEIYEDKYGITTSQRVYGTTQENLEGRGPCYLRTEGIEKEKDTDLKKAYLNMAPSQTLKWIEQGKDPSEQNVEIEGTEPYIVGGHTASGYWVNTNRETTIHGLYAAGDVAGGCPQKYVTGALVEGELAALDIVEKLKDQTFDITDNKEEQLLDEKVKEYNNILSDKDSIFTIEQMEEAMQKVMDAYAGGISSHYQFNENCLNLAKEKINNLITLSGQLSAQDYHELMFYYELKERLTICLTLIEHLKARKETRWHSFAENLDMSIRINKNKCVGCKRCLDVCPGSLIKTDATGKAYIKYPKDCWGCTSCLKECKTGAIAFFLGADIGGMGSEMTVNESKDTILWKIKKYTGEEQTIEINKKDSNKY